MGKHTPEPWEAARVLPDGHIVTRADTFEIRTPEYDVCAFVPWGAPIRKEADAHLIAAAPDLLAACKRAEPQLAFWIGCAEDPSECIECFQRVEGRCELPALRAAIAKAEGANGRD